MNANDSNGRNFVAPPDGAGRGAAAGPRVHFPPPAAAASGAAAVSGAVLDVRDEIGAAIQRQVADQAVSPYAQTFEGSGNVQGVAIGLGDAVGGTGTGTGGGTVPGAPVLTVYVAEQAAADEVRAAVVDGLDVRAAADLPMRVVTSGVIDALSNRARVRPAPGGFSIGHYRVTAGTLGCLATGREQTRDDMLLCLSNNHVIADTNRGAAGDCICQPGPADCGTCPDDQIAALERFVPLDFTGGVNLVDCATGWCWPDLVRPEIGYQTSEGVFLFRIGSEIETPALGMVVGKSGRTTQLTKGLVTGVRWSGKVNYGDAGQAFFADQVAIESLGDGPFSAGGDSGSCVWTWDDQEPVGLLFAGSPALTLANPMALVAYALDIDLVT
ncbi:hypothetical protein ETD83_01630 [Actinomadura soli]|uniref:Uncharacterized protein n=1 Tax=Actinomadura soli TaxID=2508997 RepID=A0A5C4JKA7_9ACTN|nr:hypothetical protein [Actinomadura soli]TMR07147.1 hypothetical protein ETD83_01630 [Actinomadura soli]